MGFMLEYELDDEAIKQLAEEFSCSEEDVISAVSTHIDHARIHDFIWEKATHAIEIAIDRGEIK
jgi:hypothetical protein